MHAGLHYCPAGPLLPTVINYLRLHLSLSSVTFSFPAEQPDIIPLQSLFGCVLSSPEGCVVVFYYCEWLASFSSKADFLPQQAPTHPSILHPIIHPSIPYQTSSSCSPIFVFWHDLCLTLPYLGSDYIF